MASGRKIIFRVLEASPPALVLAFFIIVATIGSGFYFVYQFPFLPEGPYRQVALTAEAIWNLQTIQRPDFNEIYQQVAAESKNKPDHIFYQDVFAVGARGELYPKHPLIVSILSAPFYGFFGEFGFWLFNQLSLLLFLSMFWCSCRVLSSAVGATGATCLLCLASPILGHSYAFSHDVFGGALVMTGVFLVGRSPFCAGLVLTASLWQRVTNLIYLPFFLSVRPEPDRRQGRKYLLAVGGALLVLGLFGWTNWNLWGSPFSTPYHRLVFFQGGEAVIGPLWHAVSLEVLIRDFPQQLLDAKSGLLVFNPVLLLLPYSLWCIRKHPRRGEFLRCLLAAFVHVVLIFSYSQWTASTMGSRFLLSAVALACFPHAAMIEQWYRSKSVPKTNEFRS